MRVIFHIDINAFFASVEEINNPNLKSLPIAVASVHGRGVVGSPNYLARQTGVRSAMSVYIAKLLCPQLVLVEHKFHYYEIYSKNFFHYLKSRFSSKIEIASIDECYIDFSDQVQTPSQAHLLAKKIQFEISTNLNLSVNIGIATNKFCAKILSNLNKPAGISACFDLPNFQKIVWPLPISEFPFIGKKKIIALNLLGIKTIGDFATYANSDALQKILLNQYEDFSKNAWNQNDDVVDYEDRVVKSISKGMTLFEPTIDYEFLKKNFYEMAQACYAKLHAENLYATNLVVSVKYAHDIIANASTKNNKIKISNFNNIYLTSIRLLEAKNLLIKPVIYLGIHLRNLKPMSLMTDLKNNSSIDLNTQIIQQVKKSVNERIKLKLASEFDDKNN